MARQSDLGHVRRFRIQDEFLSTPSAPFPDADTADVLALSSLCVLCEDSSDQHAALKTEHARLRSGGD